MCFSLTITASCPMNLQYFPMDRQLCHIEIESCKYATRACVHTYIYLYIYYIGAYKRTKYDFTEFQHPRLVLLDILYTYFCAYYNKSQRETFPALFNNCILLLRLTIDSPYPFDVNRRARARNFKRKKLLQSQAT